MSCISYISFPKALKAFLLSDIKDKERSFGITYDVEGYRKDIYLFPDASPKESAIVITDKAGASFSNCFINKYIYGFGVDRPHEIGCQRIEIILSNLDDEVKQREIKKIDERNNQLYIHVLHDFIKKHIEIGEFVEIYRVWTDHENFHFDSPTSETTINLGELSKLVDPPDVSGLSVFDERRKFVIIRTI